MPELEKEAFDMAYNWPMKDLFNEIAATAGQNTYKNDKGQEVTETFVNDAPTKLHARLSALQPGS